MTILVVLLTDHQVVVDNKSKDDESMQGDVMPAGNEMVHMLV